MRNRDFDAFLKKKSYFGRKMSVGSLGTKGSGASRPDQTVGPPDGPFGSTIIPPWKCIPGVKLSKYTYTIIHFNTAPKFYLTLFDTKFAW